MVMGMAAWLVGPAAACGGFFCDSVEPVTQSGERILFREETPGEWTTYVEVQFRGPPIEFAWVVPIPRVLDPELEIDVADAGLFDALDAATAPVFTTSMPSEGVAYADVAMSAGCESGCAPGSVGGTGSLPDTSGVEVVGAAVVGPYDLEVITADAGTNLANWLQLNGYQIPYSAWPAMEHYIGQGYAFLGVKLLPDVPAGPVDTLVLRCGAERPEIPLVLTSVAAIPDMPITAYVLAEERYAPGEGWDELDFDHEGVQWTAPGETDYDLQVLASMRALGGRLWLTEYAQPAEHLVRMLDDATAAELDHGAYITRFQAYASPEHMTVDPWFEPAPEAPDVSNVHLLAPSPASAGWPLGLGMLAVGLSGAAVRRRSR